MRRVVRVLQPASAVGLVDGEAHGVCDPVRVHDDVAFLVPRRSPNRLDERGARPEVALLVRVENCDEAHLRQVEPLPQQVDADDHVVHTEAEVAKDLAAFQGLDVGVQVVDADAHLQQIVSQLLRHPLRQRGHQDTVPHLYAIAHLLEEVVHLPVGGLHLNGGVQEAGGPDHLLDGRGNQVALVGAGRRGYEDDLVGAIAELREIERPVVQRGRQPEAVLHQRLLAGDVAVVHAPHLRHAHVRLVNEQQVVLREVVEQRPRRTADLSPAEMARVVLYAGAIADLLEHLHVVAGALLQSGRLQHSLLGS